MYHVLIIIIIVWMRKSSGSECMIGSTTIESIKNIIINNNNKWQQNQLSLSGLLDRANDINVNVYKTADLFMQF